MNSNLMIVGAILTCSPNLKLSVTFRLGKKVEVGMGVIAGILFIVGGFLL